MITKKLNVGDYIFTAKGDLARITKINKNTYSYQNCLYGYNGIVAFNGIKNGSWENVEYFECDEPQAKALEIANKKYLYYKNVEKEIVAYKKLLAKAKYFLNQLEDIEEEEVDER